MKKFSLGTLLIVTLFCSFSAFAQPGRHDRRSYDRGGNWRGRYPARTSVSVVASLPFGALAVSFGNRSYHYYDGCYYRPYGHQFITVEPPVGIIVPALPPGYLSLMVGARAYYRYGSVFYIPIGSTGYQVVQKPEEETAVATNPASDGEYEKITLEGKTYYKKGNKYYKAGIDENGEILYQEIGTTGK